MNKHIEICGGIATGKSTLATTMGEYGYISIMEKLAKNPFWEIFHTDPRKYAFETELTFMLQHYHEVKHTECGGRVGICDFSFHLDTAYANLALKDEKLEAFIALQETIRNELPAPLIIIHLKCDEEIQIERIRSRGRAAEANINRDFLIELNNAIEERIKKAHSQTPVLQVDTDDHDYRTREGAGSVATIIKNALVRER